MCTLLEGQLSELVEKVESKDCNDPSQMELLEEMAMLMMNDEQVTIDFLNNCKANHSRIIDWLCPFFDDIVYKFPSNEMINAMTSTINKYSENQILPRNVQYAIDVVYAIQNTSE